MGVQNKREVSESYWLLPAYACGPEWKERVTAYIQGYCQTFPSCMETEQEESNVFLMSQASLSSERQVFILASSPRRPKGFTRPEEKAREGTGGTV